MEKDVVIDKDLAKQLKKNPFMTKDAISEYYTDIIEKLLYSEFEEYCTEDDYYQPVVEDFEPEYYIKKWCKVNGFEFISCEGEGSDEGFEPKLHRHGWYAAIFNSID